MRTGKVFVLGAIIGAAVVWLWGREMEKYVETKTRGVRTKAAEGVRAVEEVLDRGGDALEHMSEALRAGEEAIRPAPAAGEARPRERG
jgi:hypothetical protein